MDSSLSAQRAHQAHVLFGLRQGEAEVKDFAFDFLKAARGSGFKEAELKVIFNSCLNEPLKISEQRMLRPLGFPDMINYLMNRPQPRVSVKAAAPISSIPEGRVMGVVTREDPALTTSAPESSSQPVSLRGKRERRVSWESVSEGSSTEPVTPAMTESTSPVTLSAPRPRRKKRKKGIACPPHQPLPGLTPQLKPATDSAPQPAAAPPVSPAPQPAAAPPVSPAPQPAAEPPVSPAPQPAAAPPVSPAPQPAAAPPVSPAPQPAAAPPVSPAPQPAAAPPVSPAPPPAAAPPVSPAPQPAAAPPVSPAPQPAAAPPVSPAPQPAAAPPVSPAPQSVAAPPVSPAPSVAASYVPLSSCSSARSPATVSMFSLDSSS
ncbi:uncharacterized protein [Misgurnus anguillicaudatus]|uniref:uncharacterized protein n=1 Tax=Misgurnus anguillicaudatus TaxID=75329 RepID=UPI003CCF4F6A